MVGSNGERLHATVGNVADEGGGSNEAPHEIDVKPTSRIDARRPACVRSTLDVEALHNKNRISLGCSECLPTTLSTRRWPSGEPGRSLALPKTPRRWLSDLRANVVPKLAIVVPKLEVLDGK